MCLYFFFFFLLFQNLYGCCAEVRFFWACAKIDWIVAELDEADDNDNDGVDDEADCDGSFNKSKT